jgi:DNA repair exonuclease SbcCD ATPase subunit
MAEREELIIEISAETIELVRSLATAENLLEDFGETGKYTANQLENALEAVKKDFDSVRDSIPTDKIKQYEVAIKDLTEGLGKFDGSGKKTESSLGKVDEASRRARIAVYGLNQVVRDLPFGFIAISNNIPVLIDQFQALVQDTNSVGGALKAFGRGLIGAGGISVALSAIISLVTTAVQKYGSLGAAINALTSDNKELALETAKVAKAYESFNENLRSSIQITSQEAAGVSGQIAKIDSLVSIVQNQTKSYEERNNALNELKKISKEYFGNLDIEKNKLDGLTQSVQDYKDAIIQSAITKGFEQEIGATNVQLADQERLLKKLKDRLETLRAAPQRIVGIAAIVDTREIVAATDAVNKQEKVVKVLAERTKELNVEINTSIDKYNALVAPYNAAAEAAKKLAEENKKTAASTKKSVNEAANIQLQILQSELQTLKERLAATNEFSTDYLDIVRAIANKEYEIELAKAVKIANTRDEYNRLALEAKKRFDIAMSQAVPQMQTAANIPLPGIGEIPKKIDPTVSSGYNQLVSAIKAANIAQEEFLKLNNQVATKLSDIAASFTTTLLNGALEGKNAIELLTDSVKQLVVQLAAAVVKALVFKTITAALNTAAPGSGTLVQGIASALQGSFGSFLGRSAANVGQGGLALAGQVVFVQRGPDLVGVLNNTNSRIGRVG